MCVFIGCGLQHWCIHCGGVAASVCSMAVWWQQYVVFIGSMVTARACSLAAGLQNVCTHCCGVAARVFIGCVLTACACLLLWGCSKCVLLVMGFAANVFSFL